MVGNRIALQEGLMGALPFCSEVTLRGTGQGMRQGGLSLGLLLCG